MKNMDEQFEDFFKDSFSKAELEPSENLWQNIEDGMLPKSGFENGIQRVFKTAELTPSPQVWKRIRAALIKQVPLHRRPTFWLSSAAACLLLVSGLYYTSQYGEQNPPVETQNQVITQQDNNEKNNDNLINNGNNLIKESENINTENTKKPEKEQIIAATEEDKLDIPKNISTKKGVVATSNLGLKNVTPTNPQAEKLPIIEDNVSVKAPLSTWQGEIIGSKKFALLLPELSTNINLIGLPLEINTIKPSAQWAIRLSVLPSLYYKPNFKVSSESENSVPTPLVAPATRLWVLDSTRLTNKTLNTISQVRSLAALLQLERRLNKHIGIATGFGIQTVGFEFASRVGVTAGQPQTVTYYDDVVQLNNISLQVPVSVQFYSGDDEKLLSYFVSTGLLTGLTVQQKMSNAQYDKATYRLEQTNLQLSVMGSVGIALRVMPKMQIGLEANYRHLLSDASLSDKLQSKPQWLGVGFFVKRSF